VATPTRPDTPRRPSSPDSTPERRRAPSPFPSTPRPNGGPDQHARVALPLQALAPNGHQSPAALPREDNARGPSPHRSLLLRYPKDRCTGDLSSPLKTTHPLPFPTISVKNSCTEDEWRHMRTSSIFILFLCHALPSGEPFIPFFSPTNIASYYIATFQFFRCCTTSLDAKALLFADPSLLHTHEPKIEDYYWYISNLISGFLFA
jgi:hypothetical protein